MHAGVRQSLRVCSVYLSQIYTLHTWIVLPEALLVCVCHAMIRVHFKYRVRVHAHAKCTYIHTYIHLFYTHTLFKALYLMEKEVYMPTLNHHAVHNCCSTTRIPTALIIAKRRNIHAHICIHLHTYTYTPQDSPGSWESVHTYMNTYTNT